MARRLSTMPLSIGNGRSTRQSIGGNGLDGLMKSADFASEQRATRASSRISMGGKSAGLSTTDSRRLSVFTSKPAFSYSNSSALRQTAVNNNTSNMAKLLRFMLSRNANVQISSPLSRRDFIIAANVVLASIDHSTQVTDKSVEEDFPRLLRLLGYPHAFQKSWIRSQSSAPLLLACLVWLIDNIVHFEDMFDAAADMPLVPTPAGGVNGDNSSPVSEDFNTFAMFLVSASGYERWLLGAGEQITLLDPKLEESIRSKRAELETGIAAAEARCAALVKETAAVRERGGEMAVLEGQRTDLRSDKSKMEAYYASLEDMIAKLAPRLAEGEKRVRQYQAEASDIQELINSCRNKVSTQAVTPADAELMRQSLEKLRKSEADKATMKSLSESKLAAAQAEIAAKLQDVEALAAELNTVLDHLDLADGTGAVVAATGEPLITLKVGVNPSPSNNKGYTSVDLAGAVAPALAAYGARLDTRIQSAKKARDECDANEEDGAALLQRRTETLNALKVRPEDLRERAAARERDTGAELKRLGDRMLALGEENAALGHGKAEELAGARDRLEGLRKDKREQDLQQELERERLNADLCEITDLAAAHLGNMQDMLRETLAHAENVKNNLAM